jgi:Leucine-rich repeat (LRR) protein
LEKFPQEWEVILKAQRLSLQRNKLKRLPRRFCAPDLLSLLLGGNPIDSLPASFLWSFGKLRVLDLSGGEFRIVPEELGDLKDLVWLNLSHCDQLEILPDAVRKLHVLKCLDLPGCRRLKFLPSGVVGLTALQKLCTDDCYNLRWAEHTPSGMAAAKSLWYVYRTAVASLEDICGLGVLTELTVFGREDEGVELPYKISTLTELKFLELGLATVKTLRVEMAYSFIQLQELHLFGMEKLEYLPRSFTCCGAFPALLKFEIIGCTSLVKFPEVDEGALPKLKTLRFSENNSLETLPLSLEVLTSLRNLILLDCEKTLEDCCRRNCEKSSIWRRLYFR